MAQAADRSPERGTFSAAYLVTNYFAVENRLAPQRAWKAPRGGSRTGGRTPRIARLRRQLREAREAFGMTFYGREFVAE